MKETQDKVTFPTGKEYCFFNSIYSYYVEIDCKETNGA